MSNTITCTKCISLSLIVAVERLLQAGIWILGIWCFFEGLFKLGTAVPAEALSHLMGLGLAGVAGALFGGGAVSTYVSRKDSNKISRGAE